MLRSFVVFILSASAVCGFVGCTKNEPIRLGFLGTITGKSGDLGVAGRDAVTLAVDELNRQGGINGRTIELIVKDDTGSPEIGAQAMTELVAVPVVAVVGSIASTVAKAAIPIAEKARVVMVSPTASSNEFSNRDDYFFRVMEPNFLFARHHAETALKLGARRIAALYDLQNRAYTADIFAAFKEEFTRSGGVLTKEITFDSALKPSFLHLAESLELSKADAVMVLANSADAITIIQQIRKLNNTIPIISGACGIAQRDLVQQAGKSLDNIIFTMPVDLQSSAEKYVRFKETFQKRFGYPPTMAAVLAADAAEMVFSGLRKNPDAGKLKETLSGLGTIQGLQGDLTLNKYGDPSRTLYIYRMKSGKEEVLR